MMRTVRELVELLLTLDQDAVVILSADSEGNGYSPLAQVEPCEYIPDSTWNGDVVSPEDDPEDIYHYDQRVSAVGFWPTN